MATARKPLDPNCTGGVFCPVEGHVMGKKFNTGRSRVWHVAMTTGQYKTLRERQAAARG